MGRSKSMVMAGCGSGTHIHIYTHPTTYAPSQQPISYTNQSSCSSTETETAVNNSASNVATNIDGGGLILQKKINNIPIKSNNILLDNHSQTIEDFTTIIRCLRACPTIMFMCNLNYLTSGNPDIYIQIEFYWQTTTGFKIKFAETKLGSAQSVMLQNNCNYSNMVDIECDADEEIRFTATARYVSGTGNNFVVVHDYFKPKILLDMQGSNVALLEMNNGC